MTVTVPPEMLQSTIEGYFPVDSATLTEADLPVNVVLDDPWVVLDDESNLVGLDVHVKAAPTEAPATNGALPSRRPGPPLPPIPATESSPSEFDGRVFVLGKLAYDSETGSFYFTEPEINVETLQDVPAEFRESVGRTVTRLLADYLAENAVYTLEGDTRSRAARMLLKSVRVQGGELRVELGL